jgi:hypothetical protein
MRPVPPMASIQEKRDPTDPHPFYARLDHAYRATDSGILVRDGSVNTWPDPYSGLVLSQGTPGNQPVHDSTDSVFGATTGQSVAHDGTDDYVLSAGNATSRTARCFGAVFRTGALGVARTLFSLGPFATSGGMEARITAAGNFLWVSWDGVNAQSGKFFGLSANTVYRVIASWDPVVGTYAWTLYNSGAATGTDNGSTVNTPSAQVGVMRIGVNASLAQPFNGKVYLVEVFNQTFSAGEAATLDAYYASLLV